MSITKAMWAGVSGLSAEGQALGVVGDNVANSNTIGFKQSRAIFEDVLGGAMGQNLGGGVRMARTQQLFAQGSIVNTGQATDLALTGDGFFVVKGSLGGVTGQFFTRAGQFTQDAEGFLVTPSGMKLQGYAADPNGGFSPTLQDVQIPSTPLPPKATTNFELVANLDASETPKVWDPADPANTSNHATSTTVYDSLGVPHQVDVYFVNTAPGQWEYHAMVDGGDVSGGTPGTPTEIASGTLSFTTDGYLQDHTPAASSVDFVGATPGQTITFDFGTPISAGGTGQDGITGYDSADSTTTSQSQDGYSSGELTGIQVDGDGVVNGVYSNGQQIPLAQLAVAKFASNDGLARTGRNMWMATRQSGEAAIAAAGTGGRASIVAGALEQSNVDLATQFVELIAHQRAFQANSKTITTADEMLQELVNLKR